MVRKYIEGLVGIATLANAGAAAAEPVSKADLDKHRQQAGQREHRHEISQERRDAMEWRTTYVSTKGETFQAGMPASVCVKKATDMKAQRQNAMTEKLGNDALLGRDVGVPGRLLSADEQDAAVARINVATAVLTETSAQLEGLTGQERPMRQDIERACEDLEKAGR